MIKVLYYNKKKNKDIYIFIKRTFTSLYLLENKTLIIAYYDKNIIRGCICIIDNNHLVEFLKSRNISLDTYNIRSLKGAYIYNLKIHEKYRNKKLGQKLINIVIYILNKLKYQYCHVHCENYVSKYLFKKKKFDSEQVFFNADKKQIYHMSYWLD